MRSKSAILCAILAVLFNGGCRNNITSTSAYLGADAIWERFRTEFPLNYQAIGSMDFMDNSKLFIVSEPPQDITEEDFAAFLDDYNAYFATKTLPFGVDGWVKDVVISVEGLDHDQAVAFSEDLNALIFKSPYKSHLIDLSLPDKQATYLDGDHNLKISAYELKKWFIDDGEKFLNSGGTALTLAEIFSTGMQGVFESEQDGILIWTIPLNSYIDSRHDDIRRFTLDTDLLLGAITNGSTLAIIGRERQTNVRDLPPLRPETIHLLAAANKEELSQSYERTGWFAGKIPGGKDWAPIYLSDELLNTEYGSLLNITDQMLKSWSENGHVSYTNFLYPAPDYWAFRDGILRDLEVETITYNWNTTGAVYAVQQDDYDFIAFNRTGSLPVSYFPGDSQTSGDPFTSLAEENAYNFFSNLNSPALIRANQYAALYQIFSQYGIYSYSAIPHNCLQSPDYIKLEIFNVLQQIATEDSLQFDNRLTNFLQAQGGEEGEEETAFSLESILFKYYVEQQRDSVNEILGVIRDNYGEDGILRVSHHMASPRERSSLYTFDDTLLYNASYLLTKKLEYLKEIYASDNLKKIFDQYVAYNTSCQSTWIKTPTAVLSWSARDSLVLTGGHNISSRVVPFKVSPDLPRGQYRIIHENGVKKVLIAASDVNRVTPSFLRTVENSRIIGTMSFSDNAIPIAARTRAEVIPTLGRTERGFTPSHVLITKNDAGYTIAGKKVTSCKEMIDDLVAYAQIEKPENLTIKFQNFTEDQARAVVTSSNIQLRNSGALLKPGNIFQMTSHKYDFRSMRLVETPDGIEIIVPSKEVLSTAGIMGSSMTTKTATISVRNVLTATKQNIRAGYLRVRNMLLREKIPGSIDFRKEMEQELLKQGIRKDQINIERTDCIICQINPDDFIKGFSTFEDNQTA